ncbi:MAG: DUF6491 family protein [Micropepsaceae bacterium]
MSKPAAALALIAATSLSACGGSRVAEVAAPAASCFSTAEITRFDPIDHETALIVVGQSRAYQLKITGVCPDINWRDRVVLRNEGDPSNANICTGSPVTVMTPSPRGGFQECFGNEVLAAPPLSRPAGS